jgi:hypothetical protein
MSDAFLHGDCYGCEWMTQSGRHDAISISCVNPKIKRLPVKPQSKRVDIQHSLIEFAIATPTGLAISLFSGHPASKNRLNLPEFPLA